jgi:hypothetical protein
MSVIPISEHIEDENSKFVPQVSMSNQSTEQENNFEFGG